MPSWLSTSPRLVLALLVASPACLIRRLCALQPDHVGLFVGCARPARSAFQRLADRVAYVGATSRRKIWCTCWPTRSRRPQPRWRWPACWPSGLPQPVYSPIGALSVHRCGPDQVYANGLGSQDTQLSPAQLTELLANAGHYRAETAEPGDKAVVGPATAWVRLALPLQVEQTLLGIWLFGRRDPDDYYPQRDIELLSTLANQVALASENLRLFQGVQLRLAELQALFDVSESLAKAGSLAEILQAVVDRALICAPPASSAVIHRIKPESGLPARAGGRRRRSARPAAAPLRRPQRGRPSHA